MSRDARVCESPSHEGDRYIDHGADVFEIRLEARHQIDQARDRTRLLYKACRSCKNRAFAEETVVTGTLL